AKQPVGGRDDMPDPAWCRARGDRPSVPDAGLLGRRRGRDENSTAGARVVGRGDPGAREREQAGAGASRMHGPTTMSARAKHLSRTPAELADGLALKERARRPSW